MTAIELIIEVLSWVLITGGCCLMIIGAIGAVRFPDFWTRLHAISVIDSGGMILLTAGMILQSGFTLVTMKLVLIGLFLFVTGPTSTHAVANAALVSGVLPNGEIQPGTTPEEAYEIGHEGEVPEPSDITRAGEA